MASAPIRGRDPGNAFGGHDAEELLAGWLQPGISWRHTAARDARTRSSPEAGAAVDPWGDVCDVRGLVFPDVALGGARGSRRANRVVERGDAIRNPRVSIVVSVGTWDAITRFAGILRMSGARGIDGDGFAELLL